MYSYYVLLGDFLKGITQLLQILPLCFVFFKRDYVSAGFEVDIS